MFWCDESKFLMVNNSFKSLTGYENNELYKLGFNDLSGKKNSFNRIETIHDGSLNREPKILTWYLTKKSGEDAVCELRLTRLSAQDPSEMSFFYGVLRHMDERHPEEEIFKDVLAKLQGSLAASKQGVWESYAPFEEAILIDTYIKISDRKEDFLDFDFGAFLNKVHEEDRPRVRINWERFTKGDTEVYYDEYRILNKQQKMVWVRAEGKVMERDEENVPLRVSGIIRDINDQKEQEHIILRQTQKLIDYAFMNSHLLRGPASSILGLVDLLVEEYNEENLLQLKKTTLKFDERIHEINSMIESTETEDLIKSDVQKVSFITKDSLQSLILKNTIESIPLKMTFDLNYNLEEYLSSKSADNSTEVVIIDDDSCDELWSFLDELKKSLSSTPVYILASRFDLQLIERLKNDTTVQGIILKSQNHNGLFEFLKKLNN